VEKEGAVVNNERNWEQEDFDEVELIAGCSTRFHSSGGTCPVDCDTGACIVT
jgi:hypothetical protein